MLTEHISQVKMKKKFQKALKNELQCYLEQGIRLSLNGEPSTPKSIAKACQIAEKGGYMRDYEENEMGRIACVNFDFIKKEE